MSAVNVSTATEIPCTLHRDLCLRIPDPDDRLELWREPGELRVGVVVRRPKSWFAAGCPTARRRSPSRRCPPGSSSPRRQPSRPARVCASACPSRFRVVLWPPGSTTFPIAIGSEWIPPAASAAGGRHIERRTEIAPSPIAGTILVRGYGHAHLVRDCRNVLRADVERQPRVDGAARTERRAGDRVAEGIAVRPGPPTALPTGRG